MRPHNQIKFLLSIAWIIILSLTSCQSSPTNTPTPSPTIPGLVESTASEIPPSSTPTVTASPTSTKTPVPPTPTPEPVSYGPDNFPVNINPLTGLEVSNPSLLERRPVAVKINLVPRTTYRPTWGVSLADIVWEYYHNDGYTRLHAIFYSQDSELIGAIRSARMPDHDLIQMYKSVFAYGSADQLVNQRLFNASYSDRLVLEGQRANCPPTSKTPFCRFEPLGPDLLLSGTQALSQHITENGIDNSRQNLNGMTFFETSPAAGSLATKINVHYSSDSYSQWIYDPKLGSYYLSIDGAMVFKPEDEIYLPLVDRVNEEQVQAENVVVLIMSHQYYQPPPNEIIEILMSGSGKAYAFRDGLMYEVQWNRPVFDSVLYLTLPDGSRYPFKPGQTWFQIIGETSVVKNLPENSWRFDFRFP